MISEQNYEHVKKSIQIHAKLVGKSYLVLYKTSRNQTASVMEINVEEQGFWHLIGCRIDSTLNLNSKEKHDLYISCLKGNDVSESLDYTRQPQDVKKKAYAFISVFDFISDAKSVVLCPTEGTEEINMYKIGIGANTGIIGYDTAKGYYYPKTTQDKSIFGIGNTANNRIFLILSKNCNEKKYTNIEYSISKKIFPDILEEIPGNISYDIGEI